MRCSEFCTFVLRLVVEREGLRPALDAKNAPGVAGVGLHVSAKARQSHCGTYHVDLVARDDADRSRAAGNFFLVLGVCQCLSASCPRRSQPSGDNHR